MDFSTPNYHYLAKRATKTPAPTQKGKIALKIIAAFF